MTKNWEPVHRYIAGLWNQNQYNFKTLVDGLWMYQKDFSVPIKLNTEFLISYCELLYQTHRQNIINGTAPASFPVVLVDALKELKNMEYAKKDAKELPAPTENPRYKKVAKTVQSLADFKNKQKG